MSKEGTQSVAESTRVAGSGFVGRYDHNLDPKKRFTIPREWRAMMGDPEFVYVMADPTERCVNIIPAIEMESRLAKLREKALFDPALNQVLQTIGSNSEMPPVDGQGRIRISDKLLQFANLKTTVAMVGSFRMIKLWDPAALPPEDAIDQADLDAALTAAGL